METTLFIFTGLPGSGKTTYAQKFAKDYNARLFSLDSEMHKRYGEDHHVDLGTREQMTKDELLPKIESLLTTGTSVILDYGFYKETERQKYKKLAERIGVQSKVLYFTASYDVLLERVQKRNMEENNIHYIDKQILDTLIEMFEVPKEDVEKIQT